MIEGLADLLAELGEDVGRLGVGQVISSATSAVRPATAIRARWDRP
ncbi:hypothetical protein [Streptomyces chartreusis]|nr:hypothetical protein [Streptomyces chartreusis]